MQRKTIITSVILVITFLTLLSACSSSSKLSVKDLSKAGTREIYFMTLEQLPESLESDTYNSTSFLYRFSTDTTKPQRIGENLSVVGVDKSSIYTQAIVCDNFENENITCSNEDDKVNIFDRKSVKKLSEISSIEFDEKFRNTSKVNSEVLWNSPGYKSDYVNYAMVYQDDVFIAKNNEKEIYPVLKQSDSKKKPFCLSSIVSQKYAESAADVIYSFSDNGEQGDHFHCYEYYFGRTADELFKIDVTYQDGGDTPPTEAVSVVNLKDKLKVDYFYALKKYVWIYEPTK